MKVPQPGMEQRPDALAWIDERHAIVARREQDGSITTVEIRRVQRPEARYLGDVVHEIGDRDHVMVVGPQPIRLALERRIVATSHRPDQLMGPTPWVRAQGAGIVETISHLAA